MAFNVVDRIIRHIPAHNFSKEHEKFIEWCGVNLQSPQQRVMLGATALAIQPAIDLHNKNVDEDTRKISCARTISKTLIGTLTGFLVRYGCIKLIESKSKIGKAANNAIDRFFTPSVAKGNTIKFRNYKAALGTFLAVGVMIFTNFAIDAPVTQFLTNYFNKKMNNKPKEVSNDRH